jgi:hypothetical protein
VAKISTALYVLSIKEWNLDTVMYKYLWRPFKWIGWQLQFLNTRLSSILLLIAAITALFGAGYKPGFAISYDNSIAIIFMSIALALILFSFSYRRSALTAWLYLLAAHVFILSGICISAEHIYGIEIIFYVSGIMVAFAVGYYCLQKIRTIDNDISLDRYHGYVYEQKTTSLLFLIAATGMLGFPVTAAFIGIDVLFTYVPGNQAGLITLMALCFIFIELAAIRIYCRIFLGLHKKLNHPVAFRSS